MTPPTLPADARALLAACRREPGDDTARLVFADFLDENGEDARAELIRVQVELSSQHQNSECPKCRERFPNWRSPKQGCCPGRAELLRHQRELLSANPGWLAMPCPECHNIEKPRSTCPTCEGAGDLFVRQFHGDDDEPPQRRPIATPDRGLVVLTAPASRCWETAVTGQHWDPASDTMRGGKTVTRPTPWLRAVAACPWVAEVRVNDVRPYHNGKGWVWYNGARPRHSLDASPSANLPMTVFKLLTERERWQDYPTELAAVHALSRGLLAWALEG